MLTQEPYREGILENMVPGFSTEIFQESGGDSRLPEDHLEQVVLVVVIVVIV